LDSTVDWPKNLEKQLGLGRKLFSGNWLQGKPKPLKRSLPNARKFI
jgi:hypothetical protein